MSEDSSAAKTVSPPVPMLTRICYGIGSLAYGIKDNGLLFFLVIYYNQVLGLPAPWVGLILLISLLLDGVSDPIVGYISDNFHSRWGRRHPFMYAACLPVGLAYFLLWNPPALTGGALFLYALAFTAGVRLLVTFYETPSTALAAELTDDYHERTTLLSLRFFFGWVGGITMAVITYTFLLLPTEEFGVGQLNPRGYETMGLLGACGIVMAILISAIGTHNRIPFLRQPPPKRAFSLRRAAGEIAETLSSRSFLALFSATLFIAAAAGLSTGLTLYLVTYFWELSAAQLGLLTVGQYLSALAALSFTPPLAKWLGKKRATISIASFAFMGVPLPIVLRLLDLFPENGAPLLLPVLTVFILVDFALIISASIMISSMVADLVEDSEVSTGRRSEGLFFSARTFAAKAVVGFGSLLATLVLAVVNFPADAKPGEVDPEIIRNLGLVYVPLVLGIYLIAVILLSRYKIDHQRHEDNLALLRDRARGIRSVSAGER